MNGFAEADLTCDGFLGGRIRLWQPRKGYRAAIDPVLLAAFAPAASGMRVLDLGCGAGTAGLCLAARTPGIELHGLERRGEYLDLARRNAAENGIAFVGHEGDVLRPPPAVKAASFDLVLTNPPYHPAASAAAPDAGRDAANREATGVDAWIAAALRRLRPGGVLALVHLPARLPAILAALDGPAGAIAVLPALPREGKPATRVLVRAVKGRKAAMTLLAPLTLHAGGGGDGGREGYAPAVAAVLRGESALAGDTCGARA